MESEFLIQRRPQPKWWSLLTLEPTCCLFYTAQTMSQTLVQNMLLDKSCLAHNIVNDTCFTETQSESIVSEYNEWRLPATFVLIALVTSYAGPFIDSNPKYLRHFLIVPCIGALLNDSLNFLSSWFWSTPIYVTCIYQILTTGISGSSSLFFMTSMSYLSHLSSKNERTVRIGYYVIANCVGLSFGSLISGYVQQYLGFYHGFGIAVILQFSALILGVILIKDLNIIVQQKMKASYTWNSLCQNTRVLKKDRSFRKRGIIIISLLMFPLINGSPLGEGSVAVLYLRNKFNWSAIDCGIYMSIRMIIRSAGALFCGEILKKRFRLYDASIGIVGSICELVSSGLWFTAKYSWQVYATASVGIFENVLPTMIVSLATKCVEPDEYSKLTSLFGLMSGIAPIFFTIYNEVYRAHLRRFPEAVFLITVLIFAPCVLLFGILRHLYKTASKEEYELIRR